MSETFPLTSVQPGLVPPEDYPPATRGEVVVWGLLAAYPFGGMTWQVLHHLVGLRRLGFDVWYVEDSDALVYDVTTYWLVEDTPDHNVRYLSDAMAAVGMADRWIYRYPGHEDRFRGAGGRQELEALYRRCRGAFNLCGAQELRPSHEQIATLVYLETDPVATQVAVAKGDEEKRTLLSAHDHLFTYGVNIGRPDCPVPTAGFSWHPTRPPVVIDWWRRVPPRRGQALTTVANWRHAGKDVEWDGEVYQWRKDLAFARYLDLPCRSPIPLEMALGALGDDERDALRAHGWRIVPSITIADPGPYGAYIRGSAGEFSAAKDQYVRTRCGWFSDRTACYLAAGLPVVVEDTACGTWLPTGEGVLVFSDPDEALAALEKVAGDPDGHRHAAEGIAHDYFAAEQVLAEVAATAGLL